MVTCLNNTWIKGTPRVGGVGKGLSASRGALSDSIYPCSQVTGVDPTPLTDFFFLFVGTHTAPLQ